MTARAPSFPVRSVVLYATGTLLWFALVGPFVRRLVPELGFALEQLAFVGISSAWLYRALARPGRPDSYTEAGADSAPPAHAVGQPYQTLFQHAGEAMLVVGTADLVIRDANEAASELYGRPPSALIGRALQHLSSPAPRDHNSDAGPGAQVSMWHRTASGDQIPVDLVSSSVRSEDDAVQLVVVRNLTSQLARQERLERLAHRDALTGLLNRHTFPEQARIGIARAKRAGTLFATCLLDLDGFKAVNDTLGHEAGDRVLQEVAARIKAQVRGGDVVLRLGGDEFVILLGELHNLGQCEQVMSRVLRAVAEPVSLGEATGKVTASIGVAVYPSDGRGRKALLRAADEAMYRAKAAGRNRVAFHNPAHEQRLRARGTLLDRVGKAMAADELTIVYEPVIDAARGQLVSVEAKLRWEHPVLGLRRASDFLPFVSDPATKHRLDRWVVERIRADLMAVEPASGQLGVRVNLFAPSDAQASPETQQAQAALVGALRALAQRLGRGRLTVELKGIAAGRAQKHQLRWLQTCRELGVRTSLDGLTVGSDSVHALATLGLDEVKVPAELVGLTTLSSGDPKLAAAYSNLAAALHMAFVIKGVRDEVQRDWLVEHSCPQVQGPVAGAARSAAELPELFSQVSPKATEGGPTPTTARENHA